MTRTNKIRNAIILWFDTNGIKLGFKEDKHGNYLIGGYRFHFKRGVINWQQKVGKTWVTRKGYNYGKLATYKNNQWQITDEFKQQIIGSV